MLQEVLPDATMWKKWEATEAPLRQGRGWYPTLVCPAPLYCIAVTRTDVR